MVCAADAVGSASTGSSDLDIGCLIDLATGLVSFTANGKELPTTYQVELTTQSPDWSDWIRKPSGHPLVHRP